VKASFGPRLVNRRFPLVTPTGARAAYLRSKGIIE